jgi:hypothetical protein
MLFSMCSGTSGLLIAGLRDFESLLMLSVKISQGKTPEVDDLLPHVLIDQSIFTSETQASRVLNMSALKFPGGKSLK